MDLNITFGHELHGLGAVAESAAPAVAAGEHLAAPRQEAGVELLQDHAGDAHRVLAETLHDVRLQSEGCWSVQSDNIPVRVPPVCVVPQPQVEVGVGSPHVGVQGRRHVIRHVQGPVQHRVVQTRQPVLVQQLHVGPVLCVANIF